MEGAKSFPRGQRGSAPRSPFDFPMTKPTFTVLLIVALALSGGCLFSKKTNRPKESSAISSEVEETFRVRWVEKRVSELTAQGVAAPAARIQADQEFHDRFGFNQKVKK
jgi:hypothetical protein